MFRHALVAAKLFLGLRLNLGRHLRFCNCLRQFSNLGGLAVAFAKLPLNGCHLLPQHSLALPLIKDRLRLTPDLLAEPQHFNALRHQP